MEHPNHIAMETTNGSQLYLDALYKIAPSCFTEAKDEKSNVRKVVDFTKLRLLLGDNTVEDASEYYEFTWPGKNAAKKEAADSITKTLIPIQKDSVNWDTTKNIYIEGDNLEVLKLLQNSYMGKIQTIYIDPPYNTGNDSFVYPDNYSLSVEELDDLYRDEDGNKFRKNTDSNARFHSDWCSMIYMRLMLARTLLSEDGLIFISIDDNEVDNLQKIATEVFGDDNFINVITVKTKVGGVSGSSEGKSLKDATEFILVYAKSKDNVLFNPVYVKTKLFERIKSYEAQGKSWKYTSIVSELSGKVLIKEDKIKKMKYYGYTNLVTESITAYASRMNMSVEDVYNQCADRIFQTTNAQSSVRQTVMKETAGFDYPMFGLEYEPVKGKNQGNTIEILYKGEQRRMMMFLSDAVEKINGEYFYLDKLTTLWDDIDYNNISKEGEVEFLNGKKPLKLLQRIIKLSSKEDSIVLDFFSGSASTAQAVIQENLESNTNRKFIMVQIQEPCDENDEFENICELAKERIRRAGKKIKEESPLTTQDLDIGFRVFKCEDSNYKEVAFAPKDYTQDMLAGLLDNIKEDRNDLDLLFDCMLRWGVELSLPLSTTNVDGCTIHNVNEGDLVGCFEGVVTEKVIDAIAAMDPVRVVFRDSSFTEAANKMNLFELFKQKCSWTDEEVKKNVRVI